MQENRELEFRAWDIRGLQMVYNACILTGTRNLVEVNEEHFNSSFSFFDGCIWMQYIGKTDINNKKIYEGDIVITDEAEWIAKVIYDTDSFIVIDNNDGYSIGCNWAKFEVIGNIYETPNLLK